MNVTSKSPSRGGPATLTKHYEATNVMKKRNQKPVPASSS